MKVSPQGIEWGGPDHSWYYFYWWNWLPPDIRYFGFQRMWHDGPHVTFGFWFFNWSWSTYRFCTPPFEFLNDEYKAYWNQRPNWYRWLVGME